MTARLLASIEALAIDPPGARATFVDRLATENGWTRTHAAAVDREYRRFLYLAATADAPMTPSDAVDQAWHLHLAYTRSYWDDLCGTILGRPLHHGPTQGGPDEAARYRRQYKATLDRYSMVFGTAPPATIWPSPTDRFAGSFVRTDRRQSWIIPRRSAAVALLPIIGFTSVAATTREAGYPAILIIVGIIIAVAALARWQARNPKRRRHDGDGEVSADGCGSNGGDSDGGGDGCGGGCGGD